MKLHDPVTWGSGDFDCRIMETAPTLPDFALALKPDDFQLPPADSSWNEENVVAGQASSNHLRSE